MFLFRKHQERSTDATHIRHNIPSDKVRCNPAISFLRKSSNWLTKFNKRCALRYISCSLPCSFSSVISFIILSIGDIISVSGVRNSWLTFVKAEFHLAQLLPLLRIFLYLADSELITFPPLYGIK